ncbi:hypothetical protein JI747_020275 [Chryseobacterium sp. RG1]|uniref:Lipoprotein n=1 Tax=Chryseobacterium tagetis TaxID=2801334 RepID=A0ABS8A696_9FLAO|nr:hypothetical protein [Chryseobacterium tagetis]MCA6069501.1 hypothetical protein [Chryseobacterium tagetis]
MNKLKLLLIFCFFITNNSCKSIDNRVIKAQDEYKKNLNIVKMFIDGKVIKNVNDLEKASKSLSDLSNIESHKDKGFEFSITPTKGNYIDWKQWYKDNKNIIFWNDKTSRIEVLDLNDLGIAPSKKTNH